MQNGHGVSFCVAFEARFDVLFTSTAIGCAVVCLLAAFCLDAEQPTS